nr:hypothetical protein HmN_000638200 [Hymenolepis microstoma]
MKQILVQSQWALLFVPPSKNEARMSRIQSGVITRIYLLTIIRLPTELFQPDTQEFSKELHDREQEDVHVFQPENVTTPHDTILMQEEDAKTNGSDPKKSAKFSQTTQEPLK